MDNETREGILLLIVAAVFLGPLAFALIWMWVDAIYFKITGKRTY